MLDENFLADYFQRVIEASQSMMREGKPKIKDLKRKIATLDNELDRLTDGFAKGVLPADLVKPKIEAALAEKQEAEAQIHLHTQPTPKLPDITTFRYELLQALDDPEIQKTAIRGLIEEIVVHPTAALDIQCSLSNLVSDNSATGNRTPV